MTMPYDASRKALYHPEVRPTLFSAGQPPDKRQLALEAARLAYYRYEEDDEQRRRLTSALALAGFAAPTMFHHAGTDGQGFGASNGTLALLAFRGTQPDKVGDLISDAQFALHPWEEGQGRVHAGFRLTALGLLPQVLAWRQRVPGQRLIVCGHSLGAAIATLLAVRCAASVLVTMGSPRVGDQAFANGVLRHFSEAGRQYERIVNCCDVVTRVPPTELQFHHVGQAHTYIDNAGTPRPSPDEDHIEQDRALARGLYLAQHAFRLGTVMVRDLADHAPVNYLRAFFP